MVATFVVALSWSTAADAQTYPAYAVEPGGLVNNIVTGAQYDIVNQAKAEHRLRYLHAKFRRHAESGNMAAVDHDVRAIENTKFRIVVDEWLIRKNMGLDPGCYPYPVCIDPMSRAAIAQYHGPWPVR
jgi:hypothetical protein